MREKVSNLLKKDKGFTLIEIVLVLAIAGLLLVIVFLAVSGAQKSRRDSQRKNDNARLLAAMETYAGNKSGSYTGMTGAHFQPGGAYALTNFTDPSNGNAYNITSQSNTNDPISCPVGNIYFNVTGRTVTTFMCLEQGFQKLSNN